MPDAPPLTPDRPVPAVGGELRLPKPPGVIRQFWARHPRLTDSILAALYVVPTFIATMVIASDTPTPPLVATLLQVVGIAIGGAAVLLFRRTRPWLLTGIAWFVCLLVAPFGMSDGFPILYALYALGVYRSTKAAWIGFGGSVAVTTLSAYLEAWVAPSPFGGPVATSSQYAAIMLIVTLIGVTVGNRRRYLLALIARAHDLARERDQQAQLAAAAERARIARELHDIVSHGLTVMVTLADGSAATASRDPERAAEAMRSVAETGRSALGEMRRMLGVLREPGGSPAELAPQPGLSAIPELIDGFREAGMPVRLTTSGVPEADPAVALAVYRLVQEGLTNALRHGRNAQHVEVRLQHRPGEVEVLVEDDALPPQGDAPATHGAGRGLAGLRERIALYGGTLDAGPRGARGWRLRATLPVAPSEPCGTEHPHERTEDGTPE
ncbi:histidine kinase [Agromyces sp. NBRC 114283]|uniref:sensor histidine kinase n=1 Tax=Agromyces sp. NBRC 114283 TaxID=2994521 RepID=UPI0024A43389|nr:histidine kinase [Agromyces sp. NBRC 114283]GLU89854.1 two-component sensor histidine kinase [Agromyces sp. NBRC 114283]